MVLTVRTFLAILLTRTFAACTSQEPPELSLQEIYDRAQSAADSVQTLSASMEISAMANGSPSPFGGVVRTTYDFQRGVAQLDGTFQLPGSESSVLRGFLDGSYMYMFIPAGSQQSAPTTAWIKIPTPESMGPSASAVLIAGLSRESAQHLRRETLDGIEMYVVEWRGTLADLESTSFTSPFFDPGSLGLPAEATQVSLAIWVAPSDFFVHRTAAHITVTVEGIDIEVDVEYSFSGHNVPVTIEIPPEALAAPSV